MKTTWSVEAEVDLHSYPDVTEDLIVDMIAYHLQSEVKGFMQWWESLGLFERNVFLLYWNLRYKYRRCRRLFSPLLYSLCYQMIGI